MNTYKINFKPSADQIAEIKEWLLEEDNVAGEGFFCNWSSITQSFTDDKIAVLVSGQKTIGFISWFEWEKVARIQLSEIKPDERKKGFGRCLAEKLFEKLTKKGFLVVDLHCQPAVSEKVWKRLGFKRFPDVKDYEYENSKDGPYLYKVLVPFLKPTKSARPNETIELWHAEPHQITDISPKLKWHPKFEKGTTNLLIPIISPAKRDWQINWIKNDRLIKNDKIKYFSRDEIDFGNFIIIEKLPLPTSVL